MPKTFLPSMPPRHDSGMKHMMLLKNPGIHHRNIKGTPTFTKFTVVWVNRLGVPFTTTGFVAKAYNRHGKLLDTASFDSFGVAVFSNLTTPLTQPIIIRTFNRHGVLFRVRCVPKRVAAFAIIG